MNKRSIFLLSLFLIPFWVLLGCDSPRALVGKGNKYTKEKEYEQAIAYYMAAANKKPGYDKALAGMKKAGQRAINGYLKEFSKAYNEENYTEALDAYLQAKGMSENVAKYKIKLKFQEEYETNFQKAADIAVSKLYHQAIIAVDNGQYAKAKSLSAQIERYDPNFEGLENLNKAIIAAPYYDKGLKALKNGARGDAYNLFYQANAVYPGYKSSKTLLAELEKTSKVYLTFFPFTHRTNYPNITVELYQELQKGLLAEKNPLLFLVTTNQLPSLDSTYSSVSKIASLTKSVEANRALIVEIIEYNAKQLPTRSINKTAFQRRQIVYNDGWYGQSVGYEYAQATYQEVTEEIKMTLSIMYYIIDAEKEEVLANDTLSKSVINVIKYAQYEGDYNSLFPTTGYISNQDLLKWRSRFNSKSDRKSIEELSDIVRKELVKELQSTILRRVF